MASIVLNNNFVANHTETVINLGLIVYHLNNWHLILLALDLEIKS